VGYCHGDLLISFDFRSHDSVVGESCINGFIPPRFYFVFIMFKGPFVCYHSPSVLLLLYQVNNARVNGAAEVQAG
jgi:hypothetical protein